MLAPVLAGAAMVAGCITLGAIDPTGGPPVCVFKAVTGFDCPGCGGTRAAHQLLRGHLAAALDYNVLAVILLPFIAWWLFASLVRALDGPSWPVATLSRRWMPVTLVVVGLYWVVRNIPGTPLSWLGTGS